MTKVVQVAVAILINARGEYLLASRPNGKGWAGWWEFPGGKIEPGEQTDQALSRELQEELGITPTEIQPWLKRRYDYPATDDAEAKTVLLHFYFVKAWQGNLQPIEGQQLAWQQPLQCTVSPVLAANAPIIHALALPDSYAITNLAEMGEAHFFQALEKQLSEGLQLLQIREKQLSQPDLLRITSQIRDMAKPYQAKVLINHDIAMAQKLGLAGVHLTSTDLLNLDKKPADLMVAASCHNRIELEKATALALDFVTLSPIKETVSHPDATVLGWDKFSALIANIELPVYGLGGMQISDLGAALTHGARGIAMQRAIWS